MATLLEMYRLENGDGISDEFRFRVREAVIKAAVAVHSEDAQTPNHAARFRWAKETLRSPDRMARMMLGGVCVNAVVASAGAGASDAEIEAAVAALVDHYSPEVAVA